MQRNTRNPANALLFALMAILLWSSFATIGQRLRHVPPLLLVGLALGIGSLFSLRNARSWFARPLILLFGTACMFGYHFLLFLALRLSPPIEANLLNYLWPLLIVLLSGALLPGHRLGPRHIAGALLAFLGAALAITGGRLSYDPACLPGYLLAVGAAITWAFYSVLTKRFSPFPTAAVGGFCFFSSLLALAGHAVLEPSFRLSGSDWAQVLALGLGPMGLAFYAWDAALKRGDPRVIGALSYLTPVLSTVLLTLFGMNAVLSRWSVAALVLIVGGAGISSIGILTKRPRTRISRP
jgi:drug/metabolite transporter (DMT)-like permease